MSTNQSRKNFKDLWEEKRKVLSDNPDKSAVTVKASSRLVEGFLSEVKARNFTIFVDQNKGMGGFDRGPRPSEYVLAALAACHEVTYRLYADAMDIPLEEVSVSVTGYSDAKGFFDLDDNARAGFSHIRGQINIKSSASDDDLNRLKLAVNRHCPVLDDLKSPVDVELDLVRQ